MPRISPEAYFTNLPSDGKIETPFVLKFGLAGGWGLAPIKKPLSGKSGHHHLLINTELPLDIQKPLPFSENYVHFGKGQMETVLNLEPGTHKLRLLLADDQHRLHFVYSKPTTITVINKNGAVDPKKLAETRIGLLNLKSGASLTPPFRLQFHASGLNVAHLQQKEKDTGHFRLEITPNKGGKPVELNFSNGQTEAWLAPPIGDYSLKLYLVDNTQPDKMLAESGSVAVLVR
jgi:dipeptidyl aminopeptidase/acylaminoacyl peptidase